MDSFRENEEFDYTPPGGGATKHSMTPDPQPRKAMDAQDLSSGLIRLRILHHSSEEPVYGLWIMEELAQHGYRLSAGTLYPLLHRMEKKGYLTSSKVRKGKSVRRL